MVAHNAIRHECPQCNSTWMPTMQFDMYVHNAIQHESQLGIQNTAKHEQITETKTG